MSFRIAVSLVLFLGSTANRVNTKLALDVERIAEKEISEELDDKMKSGIGLTNKTSHPYASMNDLPLDDVMNDQMVTFAKAVYEAGNAADGGLSKSKFRSVVQATDCKTSGTGPQEQACCIRGMLVMRFSEESQLKGWNGVYTEIDTDGDGVFSEEELVEVFQNRGALVMHAAEVRAMNTFPRVQGGSPKSKTKVKKYLKKDEAEKRFLKLGHGPGLIGWEEFFAVMGAARYKTGKFTIDDFINLYKRRALNAYPGDCFPVGATKILGVASPGVASPDVVEKSEVVKQVEVVPPVVTIAGNIVEQLKVGFQIQNALADRAPSSCHHLREVFLKMDQERANSVTVESVDASLDRLREDQKEEELDILRGIGADPFQFSHLVNFKLRSDEAAACNLGYRGA
jgi:hypothetical protein